GLVLFCRAPWRGPRRQCRVRRSYYFGPPMIHFACPACRKVLKVEDQGAGRKISCPRCGQRLLIPAAPAPPPRVQARPVLGEPLPASSTPSPAPAAGGKPPAATPAASTVPVNCPGCGRQIALPVGELGTLIECARCDRRFVAGEAPAPSAVPVAAA